MSQQELIASGMPTPGFGPLSYPTLLVEGLNSEFSFSLTGCPTKAREPSLPYYLPITDERREILLPFQRALV